MAEKKKKKYTWYTVALLYPDYACDDWGKDIYSTQVRVDADLRPEQKKLEMAVQLARERAHKDCPGAEANDFALSLLMSGRVCILADGHSDL